LLLLFVVVVLCFNVGQEVSKVARAKEDILQSLVTDRCRRICEDILLSGCHMIMTGACISMRGMPMLVTGDMTRRQH
jgi:hypothetical protein